LRAAGAETLIAEREKVAMELGSALSLRARQFHFELSDVVITNVKIV